MKLKEIYAVIGSDEGDGICAAGTTRENVKPLVSTFETGIDFLVQGATEINLATGMEVHLVRFKNPEILRTFNKAKTQDTNYETVILSKEAKIWEKKKPSKGLN